MMMTQEGAICARLSACTSLADVNVRDVVELMGGRRMGMQCECVIAQLVSKGKVCIDAEKVVCMSFLQLVE